MPSLAGIKAGNAYVVIGAIDDTGKMLTKIGRNIRRWGQSLTNIGTDILFKGILAAMPIAASMKWATDFDDAMKRVQARTGATNEEMNTLKQTAMDAGKDIGVSAQQIAEVMDTLSQREMGIGDINKMSRPIALLAKATGKGEPGDMENASRLMMQTLTSFGMGSEKAADIADLLTVAANKSNFALDDLREAMSKVGPMAHQMGMSVEETIAIMGMMRNAEIDAESAGVAMRNILLNASDSKEVEKFNQSLIALGDSAIEFTDKMGNLKEPSQLLFEIFSKLKKFGTATRTDLIGKLFGKRAATPAVIAGSSPEKFDEFMKSMKNRGGEAERVAREMESGLGGAFRAIANSIKELAIVLGKTLEPMLKSIRAILTPLFAKLLDWIKLNPRVAGSVVMVAASIMTLGVALIGLGLTLRVVGAGLMGFGILLTALKVTLTVVMVAFSLLGAVIMTIPPILGMVMGFISTFIGLWFSLTQVVFGVITAIIDFVLALAGVSVAGPIVAIFAGLLTAVIVLAAGLVFLITTLRMIRDVGGAAITALINGAQQLKQWFSKVWVEIAQAAVNAFGVIAESVPMALKLAAVGKFQLAFEIMMAALKVSWLEMKDVAMTVWDDIASFAMTAFNKINAAIQKSIVTLEAFVARWQIMQDLDQGKITKEQAKMAFAGINLAERMQKAGLDANVKVNPDAEAKAKRRGEIHDAITEWIKKKQEVAPHLKDIPDIMANLKDKLKGMLEGPGAGMKVPPAGADAMLKPLEHLERGTIEAAKAAYEASVNGDLGNIQQQQLNELGQIASNTEQLLTNLQIA